jgi:hypothetical protein
MKKLFAIVSLLLFVPAFATGQSPAGAADSTQIDPALAAPVPADQQPSKEDLQKLFEVMHLRDQMQNVMKAMPQIIQQSMQEQWKQVYSKYGANLTADQQAGLEKLMQKYMTEAMSAYNVDSMIADMIPIYQRHFTKDDIKSLAAFYSTPSAQRMLAIQPVIMKEYMPVVMQRMQQSSSKLTDEMVQDLTTYIKSTTPTDSPAAK